MVKISSSMQRHSELSQFSNGFCKNQTSVEPRNRQKVILQLLLASHVADLSETKNYLAMSHKSQILVYAKFALKKRRTFRILQRRRKDHEAIQRCFDSLTVITEERAVRN